MCLKEDPCDTVFVFEDSDDIVDTWYDIFNKILHKHVPVVSRRMKGIRQPRLFTNDLNNEIHIRNGLLKKTRASNDQKDWTIFKKANNGVLQLIRNTKKMVISERSFKSIPGKKPQCASIG